MSGSLHSNIRTILNQIQHLPRPSRHMGTKNIRHIFAMSCTHPTRTRRKIKFIGNSRLFTRVNRMYISRHVTRHLLTTSILMSTNKQRVNLYKRHASNRAVRAIPFRSPPYHIGSSPISFGNKHTFKSKLQLHRVHCSEIHANRCHHFNVTAVAAATTVDTVIVTTKRTGERPRHGRQPVARSNPAAVGNHQT